MRNVALTAVLALAPLAACAAPTADDAVGDSEGAVETTNGTPKMLSAAAVFLGDYGQLFIVSRFQATPKLVPYAGEYCAAYQDGTDDLKHVCENYPASYIKMSCVPSFQLSPNQPNYNEYINECNDPSPGAKVGKAPFDKGNGTYKVYFVNTKDPTNRLDTSVMVSNDSFQLELDYGDYPSEPTTGVSSDEINKGICVDHKSDRFYSNWYQQDLFMLPPPWPATQLLCPYGLRIKLSMLKEYTSQVKGCATGYDATGMSAADIAAKDAEQVKLCEANANFTLEGRDGWIKYPGANSATATLNYDASSFLATKNMHIIFSFAINGRIQSYVFHNDYVRPPGI